MKKSISSMSALLVISFLLGAFIGITPPTEVQAGPGPPCSTEQCFEFTGGCGAGGCGSCQRPYRITEGTKFNGCCGTVLESGCISCVGCPLPCLDC